MKERTWNNLIDRSKWGSGQWDDEPDKAQWTDKEIGMPCLAVRNDFGAWCGYVGVEECHPFYGKSYEDLYRYDMDVYGGLTFSDFCAVDNKERGICHIPEAGEPDNVYWFGFDCHHYLDFAPAFRYAHKTDGFDHTIYRTFDFVRGECAKLARRLKDFAK
jgi:hypothetical protein